MPLGGAQAVYLNALSNFNIYTATVILEIWWKGLYHPLLLSEIFIEHEETQTPVACFQQLLEVIGVSREGSDVFGLLAQEVIFQEG